MAFTTTGEIRKSSKLVEMCWTRISDIKNADCEGSASASSVNTIDGLFAIFSRDEKRVDDIVL